MARKAESPTKQKSRLTARRRALDARKGRVSGNADYNCFQIQDALEWLIDQNIFMGLALHGNTTWLPVELVTLTLLWIWSSTPQLTEAFVDARVKTEKLGGRVATTSYQGLMKALLSSTSKLMPLLITRMHKLMKTIGAKHFKIVGWTAIAIDGSRETASRTISNELAFSAKNYGQGKNAKNSNKQNVKDSKKLVPPPPQVWLTMLWHVGLGVAWSWKLGPSNASERTHVKEMIQSGDFPGKTLFVGDAGFVGYDLWKLISDQGHNFLVRVGGNVNLLKGLCDHTHSQHSRDGRDIVYCWPESMRTTLPPLRLRLVKCRIGNNKNVWLLTSVLDEKNLSKEDMVTLYQKRWGIELEFRALKQTFNRRKLRCRSSERVLVEIEWSIFGMAVIELMALKELLPKAVPPEKLSFAQSLTALRHSLNNLKDRPEFLDDFQTMLGHALIDDYERKKLKQGRYKPTRKKKKPCGEPNIEIASKEHRRLLDNLELQNAA